MSTNLPTKGATRLVTKLIAYPKLTCSRFQLNSFSNGSTNKPKEYTFMPIVNAPDKNTTKNTAHLLLDSMNLEKLKYDTSALPFKIDNYLKKSQSISRPKPGDLGNTIYPSSISKKFITFAPAALSPG